VAQNACERSSKSIIATPALGILPCKHLATDLAAHTTHIVKCKEQNCLAVHQARLRSEHNCSRHKFMKLFSELHANPRQNTLVGATSRNDLSLTKRPSLLLSYEPVPSTRLRSVQAENLLRSTQTNSNLLPLLGSLPRAIATIQGLSGTLWFQLNIDLGPHANTLSQRNIF
jgi:hypothetical protein